MTSPKPELLPAVDRDRVDRECPLYHRLGWSDWCLRSQGFKHLLLGCPGVCAARELALQRRQGEWDHVA